MWLHKWLRSRKRLASLPIRSARRGKARTTRLFLEPLEDRTLLSAGWAISNGGTGTLGTIQEISAPDAAGNLYVTGYFSGTATFGSTTLNASTQSSYVAKLDPNGNFLWAQQFGGAPTGSIPRPTIALDSGGNVFLVGTFSGTRTFGGVTLTSGNANGDAYLCKVDGSGNFLWADQAGGTLTNFGRGVAVDASGNAYMAWDTNLNPSGSITHLAEVDGNGNFIWSKQELSNATNVMSLGGVALDTSGNIYVSGQAQSLQPNYSGFVAKFDPTGNVVWTQPTPSFQLAVAAFQDPVTGATSVYSHYGSVIEKWDGSSGSLLWSDNEGAGDFRAFAVDAAGNLYAAGAFSNPATNDFDPGPGTAVLTTAGQSDAVVLKLDTAGNFLSVRSFGGVNNDYGWGVALDSSGNIYTSGVFSGTVNFDTGSQTVSLTSPGSTSLFIVKTTQDTGMIFGRVFNDLNNNGVFDAGTVESGIPNVTVYLDLNNSGSVVAGDPTAITDAQGYFHITDVAPGNYTLRQIVPNGYTATPASFSVSVTAGLASETTGFADYTPNTTRTYSNSTAVRTSKGKPNAVSSLSVSDSYTVLGMTLAVNVSNISHKNLTIFLTGPNGTKINLGSTTQSGAISFQVPYFDYTTVKGTWTLEVDGLAGGTLNNWSLNIDGTMS